MTICSTVLTLATRLVAMKRFGSSLKGALRQAIELLDEMDEVLIGLHPVRDHEAFVRASTLHRELELVQSQLPRDYRRALRDIG